MMKKLLFITTCLFAFFIVDAQDFSNKGKDFWITYPAHIDGNTSAMGIYITATAAATGTITVGTKTIAFTVAANSVTRKFIGPTASGDAPNTAVYLTQDDGIAIGAGIHVVSDNPVAVYAHIIKTSRSGATLVLPSTVWGKEYIVPSYKNYGSSASYGAITVVAAEANTSVQITPSVASKTGTKTAGNTYTITLANPGDVYQLQFAASADISGTKVQSVAGTGGTCKKIAVFSSTTWSAFDCTSSSGGDNLYQQLFPTGAWGKNFITSPFKYRQYDIVRVFVQTSATVVKKTENGVTTTLTGLQTGNFYEYKTANPTYIQADQPISVVHYITSTTCSNGCTTGSTSQACLADPEMVVLNPIEQTVNNITVFSAYKDWVPTGQSSISNCYLNIVIRSNATSTFKINGTAPSGSFVAIPGTSYSYLQEDVTNVSKTNPVQTLSGDSSFIAIAYGFGTVESYGYNAGTNVKDFTKIATFQNQYARLDSAVACVNTPFNFGVPLSFKPTSIKWDFSAAPNITPNANIGPITNPNPDSTNTSTGLNYYSTGNSYSFIKANTTALRDTIKVYTTSATADGCGSTDQIYSIPVKVTDLPTANFTTSSNGCLTDSLKFIDASDTHGDSKVIVGLWDYGDGTTDSAFSPKKLFKLPKTYPIHYRPITNYGCIGDVIIPITFSSPATAKFGINDTTCVGNIITFTDSSSITTGTIVKWYWDYGNGVKETLTASSNQTQTYNIAGTYTVSLIVENNTGCKSNAFTKTLNIHPKPVPDFKIPAVVCLPVGAATFYDSTKIADATTTFKYQWSFGDGGVDSVKNPTYNFASVGPFSVNLKVTSVFGCIKDSTKQLVNIYAQPKAAFTVSNEVCLRDTTVYTDASDGKGSTITKWNWTFGDGSTDTLQNTKHRYAAAGTDSVKLFIITDKGCYSDTATKATIVNPLPSAGFSYLASAYCETKPISFTDSSKANAGNLVRWHWLMGDGRVVDTTNSNTFANTYAAYGNYTVQLMVESNKGCKSDTISKNITINPLPQVNFSVPNIVCLPVGAATFYDSTKIADATTTFKYQWSFGDGGVDSVKNPTHNFASVGPFSVNLKVTSVYGCVKDSTKQLVNIYAQPKAAFTVSNEVCLRDTTLYTDASDGKGSTITKWNWAFGDGTTDTLQNTKHRYATAGTKIVKLFVITDKGCYSDTSTKTTLVNPLPNAGFSYTATAGAYCETRPVAFTDTSKANVGTLTRWHWLMGDGRVIDTANGNTFNHSYAAYGTYTVKLMTESSKGCKSDTVSQTVAINPLPQVGFIVPEICLSDAFANFTDTSKIADGSPLTIFSWSFDASTATPTVAPAKYPTPLTSTSKNPQVQYKQSSNYFVKETVTSNKGCVVSKTNPFTVNGIKPKAGFVVLDSTHLCSNTTVKLTDLSTVDFGTVSRIDLYWNNAVTNPVDSIDQNPANKTYNNLYPDFQNPTKKTYQVKLVARSGNSAVCADSVSQTITINQSPKVQFVTIPGICNDTTARQITQAKETTSPTIAGSFTYTGTGVSSTGLFSPRNVAAGTYNIQYKYSSTIGCADSATQPITVWPSPVAKWGVSSPDCEKNNIIFTDSSVANYKKIKTWAWVYGDGNTANRTDSLPYQYTYAAAGSYTAGLRVTTDSGCRSAINTQTIKINYLPKVSFTLPTICLPDGNGTFTSTSTIGDGSQALFSYAWDFADPNNSSSNTSQAATHQYSALPPTGGYAVKLIITTNNGCKDSLTQAYTDVNPQPKAAFTATPQAVCVRDIINFTDKSDGKTSAVNKWYWDLAQGQSSNAQNPNRQFNDSGSYQVQLWVDNAQGCRSDTANQTVVINPYPILELGPNLVVLEGGTVALKPQTVYGNSLAYLWTATFPPNSPTYLDSDTAAIPKSSPVASVDSVIYNLKLTGIGGCAVNDNITVVVLHTPIVPNTFSPNGDGVNDRWVIKSLESYPGATIEIYNRYGQVVYKATGYDPNNAWDGTLNGSALPVATYYYIINPKNGRGILSGSITIIR